MLVAAPAAADGTSPVTLASEGGDTPPDENLLAYVRPGDKRQDDVLVLLNWGSTPLSVPLPDSMPRGDGSGLVDLISGDGVERDASVVSLPAYGVRVLSAAD